MDFENKYRHLRSNKANMPEGYLEELQQKVNRKKELKKVSFTPYIVGTGIAAMLIIGLFVALPVKEKPAEVAVADTVSSEMADQYVRTLMDDDNLLAQNTAPVKNTLPADSPATDLRIPTAVQPATAPADVFADSSFSEDELFEYLLEEGFEEI